MSTTPNLKELDDDLNNLILTGKALEGFEKYYADDVEMRENSDEPFRGKDVNRKREEEFFSSVEQFHGAQVVAAAHGDGISMSEWVYDITFKGGQRMKLEQAVVRRWRDGKIVSERFYYNKG